VGECDKSPRRLGTVCIMNADGSDPQPVPSSIGVEIAPHWSPDGEFLVVSSRPVGSDYVETEIYVIAVNDTERIRLTDNKVEDNLVEWGVAP